nr:MULTISPECIES: alpha-hydroxy-acid oxidizing protein [Ensifer]
MDCAPTAVDALPGIADTVGGRMTILADSIICRGSDISINVGHAARVVSA